MKKKVIALLLCMCMLMASFAGCSKKTSNEASKDSAKAAGTPTKAAEASGQTEPTAAASKEETEFVIACPAAGDTNPPMSEWWIWKEYEKKTGVKIKWEEIPSASLNEKKTLMMTSDDMPDAFWQITFSTDELIKYGSQGSFVNIAPYLDKDAPNLKSLLTSEIDGGLAAVTMPDGGIYSMPWVMTDQPQMNLRYYINKNWLKNLNLQVPTTIDELSAVFEAFKTKDANGNGKTDDEWPIYYQPDGISTLEQQLAGSYGIGNNGFKPLQESYYIDKDGKVQYLYTSDGMKQIWQQMADWWTKGYFQPDTFGTTEYEKWVTDGKVNKIVGMYGWGDAAFLYSDASKDYVGVSAFTGPNGDAVQSWCDFPVRSVSAFTITNKCKDPEKLIQWADYFYGKEGIKFAAFGTEGQTYNNDANGNPVYIDDILNYKGGPQLGAWQYGFFVYGGNFPWWSVDSTSMEIARKYNSSDYTGEKFSDYVEDSKKHSAKLLPGMIPTAEEANETPYIMTDVETYVKEARQKFVTGEWNFTSDWDAYVKQLKTLGIDKYVEIKSAQYGRYLSANK